MYRVVNMSVKCHTPALIVNTCNYTIISCTVGGKVGTTLACSYGLILFASLYHNLCLRYLFFILDSLCYETLLYFGKLKKYLIWWENGRHLHCSSSWASTSPRLPLLNSHLTSHFPFASPLSTSPFYCSLLPFFLITTDRMIMWPNNVILVVICRDYVGRTLRYCVYSARARTTRAQE